LVEKAAAGNLRPGDLRSLVARAAEIQARAERNAAATAPDPVVLKAKVDDAKARVEAELAEALKAPAQPDTVNIRKPGQYDIDVKALLDQSPVVVHRDGAYHIHLASLFDQR
jgi:predicted  nucleic acid-binding Zn-ribbon protein